MPDLDAPHITSRLSEIHDRLREKDDVLGRRQREFLHERLMTAAARAMTLRLADLTEQFRENPAEIEDLCWFVLSLKGPGIRRALIDGWESQGRIDDEQAACMREICGLRRQGEKA